MYLNEEIQYLGSEHEWDGGEVAVADGQQAEKGDVVALVLEEDLQRMNKNWCPPV